MKSYYQLIRRASYEFTAKNHFATGVIRMNERVYSYLLQEMYGDEWWVLIHSRRIMGLKIILDNEVYDFLIDG